MVNIRAEVSVYEPTMKIQDSKASDFIKHFDELISVSGSVLQVVLYLRVSRCWQEKNGNLKDQESYLRKRISELERKYKVQIKIVDVFTETASGWISDRVDLYAAARKAKACAAVLLAESSCRYIRSQDFHSSRSPDVLPLDIEYKSLKRDTKGAIIATLIHPDTPWKEVRSYQAKRGQSGKNRRGGRPKRPGHKKERRLNSMGQVMELYKKGNSIAAISRETGIAWSTVKLWISKITVFSDAA